MLTDLLEALTILCFGLSWPVSIHKSWVSRTAKGKSVAFEVILLVGYKLRTKDVQVMSQYNNGQISKDEAEAILAAKYGPAGER